MTVCSGQMSIYECIAEAERGNTDCVNLRAFILAYIEPCVPCAGGRCNMCDGSTVDHATADTVPCPCRAAGHGEIPA